MAHRPLSMDSGYLYWTVALGYVGFALPRVVAQATAETARAADPAVVGPGSVTDLVGGGSIAFLAISAVRFLTPLVLAAFKDWREALAVERERVRQLTENEAVRAYEERERIRAHDARMADAEAKSEAALRRAEVAESMIAQLAETLKGVRDRRHEDARDQYRTNLAVTSQAGDNTDTLNQLIPIVMQMARQIHLPIAPIRPVAPILKELPIPAPHIEPIEPEAAGPAPVPAATEAPDQD